MFYQDTASRAIEHKNVSENTIDGIRFQGACGTLRFMFEVKKKKKIGIQLIKKLRIVTC
jgi:hypothetical protein